MASKRKGHWRQRKPMWAILDAEGMLHGHYGTASLYDRKSEAASVLKSLRHHYGLDRVVKVYVKYEEVP